MKILIGTLLAFVNLCGLLIQCVFAQDEKRALDIPDAALKACIIERLDIKRDFVTEIDILKLIDLNCDDERIRSLKGIEYAINLKALSLRNNDISDIRPLTTLPHILDLNLSKNLITDVSAIRHFTDIENLDVSMNEHIDSIEDLVGLKTLKSLNLSFIYLTDIASLSQLENLYYLNLNDTGIKKLDALANLHSIQVLLLDNNAIANIRPLRNLGNLFRLSFNNNFVSKISVLSELKNLHYLEMKNNEIYRIEPLIQLENLRVLYVMGNCLNDPQFYRRIKVKMSDFEITQSLCEQY